MSIDIARHIGAVSREVLSRDFDGRPARIAVASRTFDTTIDDTWDALTNAERIPRWFMPISGDLRLGGRFALTGNASGEILTCERPRLLKVTWEYGGLVSWVEVRLEPKGKDATQLRLEHIAHVSDEDWAKFGPGAVGVGWDMALLGLAQHLGGNVTVKPEEAMVWISSDEGKTFVRGASEGWYTAAVAGGDDAAAARAAADRTTAAYTGEEVPPKTD